MREQLPCSHPGQCAPDAIPNHGQRVAQRLDERRGEEAIPGFSQPTCGGGTNLGVLIPQQGLPQRIPARERRGDPRPPRPRAAPRRTHRAAARRPDSKASSPSNSTRPARIPPMPDMLAIISKAVFEKEAAGLKPGDVLPTRPLPQREPPPRAPEVRRPALPRHRAPSQGGALAGGRARRPQVRRTRSGTPPPTASPSPTSPRSSPSSASSPARASPPPRAPWACPSRRRAPCPPRTCALLLPSRQHGARAAPAARGPHQPHRPRAGLAAALPVQALPAQGPRARQSQGHGVHPLPRRGRGPGPLLLDAR